MNILNLSALFFAFCTLIIGFLVYFKRQDEVGKRWLFFSFTASIWGFFYSLWAGNFFDEKTSHLWMKLSHTGSAYIPIVWVDFIFTFLGVRGQKKAFLRSLYLFSIFLSFAVWTPYFWKPFVACPPFKYYPQPGPVYHLFTGLFFGTVGYGFIEAIRAYQTWSGERRRELKYLILATGIGFFGGSLTFLPVYGLCFPQYNLLMMPFYPFLMAYAITRHHVLEFEEIAQAAQRDKLAAIGTLAASINHEIRNPLYVIKGFAESYLENLKQGIYANEKEAIQKSTQILSKTIEQAERAMEIMKRFSSFAKQGSREGIQLEAVDIGEAFDGILPLIRYELELDKIQLVRELPETLSAIRVDRRNVEEIFFNLVLNACQAMKDGGRLTIRAEQHNGMVQIEIQDQGPGIPSDKVSKIFEPFYTTKASGTGLGLYVTKRLVERNRGKISVESELNKGTRFTLRFPIHSQ